MTLGQAIATAAFGPKHGTAERWNDCNCHACATARVGQTLNIEEVRDAGEDGVELSPLGGINLAGEVLRHDGVGHFYHSGAFRRLDDRRWEFAGSLRCDTGVYDIGFDMSVSACEALDRVREYWRRRALAEFAAAKVADHLGTALAAAREHAQLFAKIGDDGVFPDDKAQDHRAAAMGFSFSIKDLERLLNSYKHHGDVP